MDRVALDLLYDDDLSEWPSLLMRVPVFLNGRGPFRFGIEFQRGVTLILSHIAKQLEVETNEMLEPWPVPNSAVQFQRLRLRALQVGSITIPDFTVYYLDIQDETEVGNAVKIARHEIDGVLGYDFFQSLEVQMNFAQKWISFKFSD